MRQKLFWLFIGLVLGLLVFKFFPFFDSKKSNVRQESQMISFELQKLNKMVAVEKQYANLYSHQDAYDFLDFSFGEKKVILLVKTKVQVSYDLNQMKVELDSINKKIVIQKLPDAKFESFPSVEFKSLDQSIINQFTKDQLNQIKNKAALEIEKNIDKKELEEAAEVQLMENLSKVFLLAKVYNWQIENQTPIKLIPFD
ncbi:MAG: DUF4230 domain-containing protein [Flavobacteriaceae bacterium]|nr:MAG: DUF4230 domain-containing protein [Flavobacteriaceae bacterium]